MAYGWPNQGKPTVLDVINWSLTIEKIYGVKKEQPTLPEREEDNGVNRAIRTNNGAIDNPRNANIKGLAQNGEDGNAYKEEQEDKQTLFKEQNMLKRM